MTVDDVNPSHTPLRNSKFNESLKSEISVSGINSREITQLNEQSPSPANISVTRIGTITNDIFPLEIGIAADVMRPPLDNEAVTLISQSPEEFSAGTSSESIVNIWRETPNLKSEERKFPENTDISPDVVMHVTAQASIPTSRSPKGMRYEDLSAPRNQALREQVLKDNLCYSAYMYGRLKFEKYTEGLENGMQITIVDDELLMWRAKDCSPEENKILLDIARAVTRQMGFEVDPQGNFYHLETGTIFNLVYDIEKKEINVCFMGLDNAELVTISKKQQASLNSVARKATIASALGSVPKAVTQAMAVGQMVKALVAGSQIKPVMVGHSHGGELAQAAAIANGIKGVVFNAAPLGKGTKKAIDAQIGKKNRQAFSQQVTAFSVKGDWLTDGSINALCRFGRDHGMPVATVMGKGYQLPTVPGRQAKHCNFYEAFTSLKSITN